MAEKAPLGAGASPVPPPAQYQMYGTGQSPAYPAGPQPAYPAGQPYPAVGTTVVITKTSVAQPAQPQPKPKKKGFFGSIMSEVDKVGKQIGKEIDYVGNKINEAVDTRREAPVLSQFLTGNVVQLVSRTSGKALQILSTPDGRLTLDGRGLLDPNAYNAVWTVVNEGNNQVRLHNNHNYLTVANGQTTVAQLPPGSIHGIETKWQLATNMEARFVLLESLSERGRHLGVLQNGDIKPAIATVRENDANFGVMLVYSPFPPPQTTTTTTTVKK